MAKLKVYYSSMRAGKSSLAVDIKENFDRIGDSVVAISPIEDKIKSRKGGEIRAIQLTKDATIKEVIGNRFVEHILIDEAQFITIEQAEEIARIVDDENINVYCFGLLTDFRGKLFTGTKRLVELADEVEEIQAKSLCWCGRKGTHNMRIDSYGYPVVEGDVVGIGEHYEVLCRKHFYDKMTHQVRKDIVGGE